MARVESNTEQLDKLYYDMLADIKIYNDSIESFFNLIRNIPSTTQEWIGTVAEKYISNVCAEEVKYNDLGTCLTNFASIVEESRSNQNTIVNNSDIKDGKYEQNTY